MKTILILTIATLAFTCFTSAQEKNLSVGTVDYRKVESLLEKIVLADAENAELKESYYAYKKKSEESQKRMHEAMMKGEKINPMKAGLGMMEGHKLSKDVKILTKKYLLQIIKTRFKGKYDLILKGGYSDSVLYSGMVIDDLTVIVEQELLEKLPK